MAVVFVVSYEFFYSCCTSSLPWPHLFIVSFSEMPFNDIYEGKCHTPSTERSPSPKGDSLFTLRKDEISGHSCSPLDAVQTLRSRHSWNRKCFSSITDVLYRLSSSHWLQSSAAKRQVSCVDNGLYSFQMHSLCILMLQYLLFMTSLMPLHCFSLFPVVRLKLQKLCRKCHNTVLFLLVFILWRGFMPQQSRFCVLLSFSDKNLCPLVASAPPLVFVCSKFPKWVPWKMFISPGKLCNSVKLNISVNTEMSRN